MEKYGSDLVFMRQPSVKDTAFICWLNSVQVISKSCVFEKLSDGSLQFLAASSLSQHQQLYW